MRIRFTTVFVDDQATALAFYTDVLGFVPKRTVAVGEFLWLTVISPDDPDGVELLLEPPDHPAVSPYREALVADGIPAPQFAVTDVQAELERLRDVGVTFTQEPTDMSPVTTAVFDDTCGNLIQITTTLPCARRTRERSTSPVASLQPPEPADVSANEG